MNRRRATCCCGGGGGTIGPCICATPIGSIAVTVTGLAKCADIVNCASFTPPGQCITPGDYAGLNSVNFGSPPNGSYLVRPCPLPANGCRFAGDLGDDPVTTDAPNPLYVCGTPHSGPPGTRLTVCTPTVVNTNQYITLDIVTGFGTWGIANAVITTVVSAGRVCQVCVPFGTPAGLFTVTEDIQYQWRLPSQNANISVANFCAGQEATITGNDGFPCGACGYAGPGTFLGFAQAVSSITVKLQRVS